MRDWLSIPPKKFLTSFFASITSLRFSSTAGFGDARAEQGVAGLAGAWRTLHLTLFRFAEQRQNLLQAVVDVLLDVHGAGFDGLGPLF